MAVSKNLMLVTARRIRRFSTAWELSTSFAVLHQVRWAVRPLRNSLLSLKSARILSCALLMVIMRRTWKQWLPRFLLRLTSPPCQKQRSMKLQIQRPSIRWLSGRTEGITIDDREVTADDTLKCMMVKVAQPGEEPELAGVLIPGSRALAPKRLEAALEPATFELATEEDFRDNPFLVKGYVGPRGLN